MLMQLCSMQHLAYSDWCDSDQTVTLGVSDALFLNLNELQKRETWLRFHLVPGIYTIHTDIV